MGVITIVNESGLSDYELAEKMKIFNYGIPSTSQYRVAGNEIIKVEFKGKNKFVASTVKKLNFLEKKDR